MSKVNTLINLITYQKQHPHANDSQIATGIGITPQYLKRCKGELNLLKQHLSEGDASEQPLEADQIHLMMSVLDQHDPYQREIYRHLRKHLIFLSNSGTLRMVRPDEKLPYGWLTIGELIPTEMAALDSLPSSLDFWFLSLCYDPLLRVRRDGEIDWWLATSCEPVKDYSHWRICLRTDARWSDGKPISPADVIHTLSSSHLAPLITKITSEGKTQLHVWLAQAVPLFPLRLSNILIRPSHSPKSYWVTSGAYRLKRFRRNAITFRFKRNCDYYRQKDVGVDWIILRRFRQSASAIKAISHGEIDFMPLRALQFLYQVSDRVPLQHWPFFEQSYYVLFLNRHREPLKDERNCYLLSQAIDYRAINRYLHAGKRLDERVVNAPLHRSLDLRITCSKKCPASAYLAYLVGKSVNASIINPVPLESKSSGKMLENVDAFLTPIHFGLNYSRLPQYFRSDGENNPFVYANPQVDEILYQLDQATDQAQRQVIGKEALSLLQDDFAMIPLSPCVEYILSPFEIQFDENLTNLSDFAQNMSNLVVERNPLWL